MLRRRPTLLIVEQVEEEMLDRAHVSHPHETGGVLLGVTTGGRLWVTEAVEVPTDQRGTNHFELPEGARHRAVRDARRSDERLGYVGDWHSHPADSGPSGTDRQAMRRLAADPTCPRPVLAIVRQGRLGSWIDARQWNGRALRHMELERTGPLDHRDPVEDVDGSYLIDPWEGAHHGS